MVPSTRSSKAPRITPANPPRRIALYDSLVGGNGDGQRITLVIRDYFAEGLSYRSIASRIHEDHRFGLPITHATIHNLARDLEQWCGLEIPADRRKAS